MDSEFDDLVDNLKYTRYRFKYADVFEVIENMLIQEDIDKLPYMMDKKFIEINLDGLDYIEILSELERRYPIALYQLDGQYGSITIGGFIEFVVCKLELTKQNK
jgi:superfamily II helicase